MHSCEILQYQNKTDRNDTPSYADIYCDEMIDNITPEIIESRHRYICNTTQSDSQHIFASIQQEERNCNNYESLSNN